MKLFGLGSWQTKAETDMSWDDEPGACASEDFRAACAP